ncbi:unnamed protein product, partial [Symbiodinium necroappetens]
MFKAVLERVKKWVSGGYKPLGHGSRQALLDSGATHVLRAPWNEEEWNGAKQVNVQLAGDHVAPMKQNEAGSLLSGDQLAQVIVPLGKVISTLGYKLSWTSEVCELIGPSGEVLPLTVKNGCPEVSEKTAYKLIQELEDQQLPRLDDVTQASVQAIHGLKTSWWSYLKEYVRGGNVIEGYSAIEKANFFDYKDVLKEHLVTRLPKLGIWELLKTLNINRRARKRLLRASGWIIRWDAPSVDKSKDSFKQLAFVGSQIYVNMNTLLIENEFADVWRVVQWAAFVGKVDVVGYGRSPDGKFFKYFVIGALRIPKVDGAEGHPDVRGHPLPPPHEEGEECISDEEEDLPPTGADEAGVGLDEVEKEKKQWEDLVATFKQPLATTTLYFAVPVNNKR